MTSQIIPVLNFHDIGSVHDNGVYPESMLDLCMSRLYKLGYQSCLPYDLEKNKCSDKAFIICFDDGYRTMYEVAYPILKKYGFKAMLFIVTGDDDQRHGDKLLPMWSSKPMMSWQQVRELSKDGFSIGSHTATHRKLSELNKDEVHAELTASKQVIEQQLGHTIDSIAYPYGQYNELVLQSAQSQYLYGFTDKLATWRKGTSPLTIPRIDMDFFNNPLLINILCSRILPWYLTARRQPHEWRQRRRHQ